MIAVDGFRLAVGTLTRFPVPPPGTIGPAQMRAAVWWFIPVSGLLSVLAVCCGWALTRVGAPHLAAATVAIAFLAWVSRGLHWDGLADTADGLHVSWDRERALRVMRASDIGPMGVLAIVFTAAVQVSCLAVLLEHSWAIACLALFVGRCLLGLACGVGTAAQPDGLGSGFYRSCSLGFGAFVTAVAAAAGYIVLVAGRGTWHDPAFVAVSTGFASMAAAWAVVFGVATASGLVVVMVTKRGVGGATGDTLGAVVEFSTAAALLAAVCCG